MLLLPKTDAIEACIKNVYVLPVVVNFDVILTSDQKLIYDEPVHVAAI
jgi:hypothetical protein